MTLITEQLVALDLDPADRHEATRRLAERLVAAGRCTDLEAFLAAVRDREEQMPTGIEGGIGIPHARSSAITEATVAFGRVPGGVDFGAPDGPARLIFLLAAPEGSDSHLAVLSALARRLVHASFRESLLSAPDALGVVEIFDREVKVAS